VTWKSLPRLAMILLVSNASFQNLSYSSLTYFPVSPTLCLSNYDRSASCVSSVDSSAYQFYSREQSSLVRDQVRVLSCASYHVMCYLPCHGIYRIHIGSHGVASHASLRYSIISYLASRIRNSNPIPVPHAHVHDTCITLTHLHSFCLKEKKPAWEPSSK